MARFQPRLLPSAHLSLTSLSRPELLGLRPPNRTPICFQPCPCLQCLVCLEHICPLISKSDHLRGHGKCPFSLHPSLAMYPLNLHGHQASLKQLVQTRMPKACSSPPNQAPFVYKDKHHLPVAPLLLAPYFLSSSKRCRLHLQILSVWPLLVTSTVPTLGQNTDSCPLDSAIVTNCNRCLFPSKQWPERSFQNGSQAQHKLSRNKSQEWLTRPSCSSRTLPTSPRSQVLFLQPLWLHPCASNTAVHSCPRAFACDLSSAWMFFLRYL